MSDVSALSSSSVLSGYELKTEEKDKSTTLGQSAFLELMITQLNNQNPLDPQDNSEFVAQLAQFSSVEGLERLNSSMDGLVSSYQSSQALQASALVGRSVRVPADSAALTAGGKISGTVELESSTSQLSMNIYNSAGVLVRQIAAGSQDAGEVEFTWDGKDDGGNSLPAGTYKFEALALQDGETQAVATTLSANVNSVTLGAKGAMTLNLNGMGSVPMSSVKQIL